MAMKHARNVDRCNRFAYFSPQRKFRTVANSALEELFEMKRLFFPNSYITILIITIYDLQNNSSYSTINFNWGCQ